MPGRQTSMPNTNGLSDPSGGVPLPISAILSPKKAFDVADNTKKIGQGDPAIAQALMQLYPDLVRDQQQQQQQQQTMKKPPPQMHGVGAALGGSSQQSQAANQQLAASLSQHLTPLLVDCNAHRQSLLSMNQVLNQLYSALTVLNTQLQEQPQQAGVSQQLAIVVDQLKTGIGAFCGHVVQCCNHFYSQISSPILQIANQVFQHQNSVAGHHQQQQHNIKPVPQMMPQQLPVSRPQQPQQQQQQQQQPQAPAFSLPQLQQFLQNQQRLAQLDQQQQHMPTITSAVTSQQQPSVLQWTNAHSLSNGQPNFMANFSPILNTTTATGISQQQVKASSESPPRVNSAASANFQTYVRDNADKQT